MGSRLKNLRLVAAVFTPFDDDGEVNLQEIPKYSKYLADHNVNAILVNGTAGEGPSLTFEERKSILEAWVKQSKTVPLSVIAQIGGTNSKQAKELAAHAEELKVDAILCLPDLYFKPKTVEDLLTYLKEIAQSAPTTPLLYYHLPFNTGVQLDMKKLLEVGSDEIPTLAGLKFSQPVLGDELRCLAVHGGKYTIFHGYDQILTGAFTMGIDNIMVTSLNFAAESISEIKEHIKNGRNVEALALERKLMMLSGIILNMTSWIAGFKAVTSIITGIELGNPRSPIVPLTREQNDKLRVELRNKGWLK